MTTPLVAMRIELRRPAELSCGVTSMWFWYGMPLLVKLLTYAWRMTGHRAVGGVTGVWEGKTKSRLGVCSAVCDSERHCLWD